MGRAVRALPGGQPAERPGHGTGEQALGAGGQRGEGGRVWTPNTGPRTVIIAVPWVFTQYTAVEAASVPDRFWYRTRMSFPVRTENSVIERLGVSRWLGGAERC